MSNHARWLVPLGIAAITVLAFAPALYNGFVSWDDSRNFLDNPHYRGLGGEQLRWMWSTFLMGHYVPLTWMTLGLDYVLWGMNPAGYHATSILLHAANAVLVFFLARRLLALTTHAPSTTAAAFAALFFALHPLRVESVAWVTERRDTLSLLFYLSSVLAYLRFHDTPKRRTSWYWIALAAFVGALLSKGTSVTLPAALALLNVYPLRRINSTNWRGPEGRRVVLELAPFAVLAAGFSLLSIVALHPPTQLGPGAKLAVSAYSLQLYLTKTALPIGLTPLYEMPTRIDVFAPRFLVAYVMCVVVALVAWRLRRRWPGATAAIVAFALISLPMLGIVQNGPQIAADRYTYHASPALAILVAGLVFAAPIALGARRTIAAVVIAVLGLLTWKQTQVWHNSAQLWARVLDEDPSSVMGQSAMANVRYKQGRIDEGLEYSRRAVELSPTFAQAHNDLGVGLASRGQLAEAASEYRTAIALDSTNSDEPLNNLGVILVRQGDLDGGIQNYRRALEINADYADAHVNWGNALVRERQFAEAIPHYEAALMIRPADADAHHNWGVALAQQGRFAEAADQFRAALAIDPDHAEAKDYLARATRLIAPR